MEALQIRTAKKTMNLDAGLQLNPIWSTLDAWHYIIYIIYSYIIHHYVINIKYMQLSFVLSVQFCILQLMTDHGPKCSVIANRLVNHVTQRSTNRLLLLVSIMLYTRATF